MPAIIVIAVPASGVLLGAAWGLTAAAFAAASPPLPNARQLDFMEMETAQFMHFNVDTAWTPPPGFLNGTSIYGSNPTCERLFVSGALRGKKALAPPRDFLLGCPNIGLKCSIYIYIYAYVHMYGHMCVLGTR